MTAQMNIDFDIQDKVRIIPLGDMKGEILSIWITLHGIKYEVRYFWECKPQDIYFFANELRKDR